MFSRHPSTVAPTAIEIRGHLAELLAERALAVGAGLARIDAYMADLDDEIDLWRHEYVATAEAEIATLRAELSDANTG